MKRIFNLFLLLSCGLGLSAQNLIYLGAGPHLSYSGLSEVNRIIDKFNVENQDNFSTMGNTKVLYGPGVNIGANLNGFLVDLGYRGRFAFVSSTSENQSNTVDRDVQVSIQTAQIGLGKMKEVSEVFSVGGGLSLDFGTMQVLTRFRSNNLPANYNPTVREAFFGTSLYGIFMIGKAGDKGWALQLRPFIQMDWLEHDAFPFNRSLNNTSFFDDPDYLPFRAINGGLAAIFCVFFRS